jgi:hypothetical protein
MADLRQQTTFGNRYRLVVRCVGLTALVIAIVGSLVALTAPDRPPSGDFGRILAIVQGTEPASVALRAGWGVALLGFTVTLVWLISELLGGLFLVQGRKQAAGTANSIRIVLALLLCIVVNLVSFREHRKFDLTRSAQFTLPAEATQQLRQLRAESPTTVVVLQLHKTAGTLTDKPDAYDYAAERKTVEKVRDLVDQLREFGPQFTVAVLDVEDEKFERQLRELSQRRPGLRDAVLTARENSVFLYADGKVRSESRAEADRALAGPFPPAVSPDPDDTNRRLVYPAGVTRVSFTEFLQLDKTSSREATATEREGLSGLLGGVAYLPGVPGRGNLVLIPQGEETFLRRVVALEERRPRVGLAVIHPYLSSRETLDEYSAAGLRQSLEANGFQVTDLILKRWSRGGPPTAAAYTFEESELDRVENRVNLLTLLLNDRDTAIAIFEQARQRSEATLARLNEPMTERARIIAEAAAPLQRFVQGRITTEAQLRTVLQSLNETVTTLRDERAEFARRLAEATPRYQELVRDERASEGRRMTDVAAKFRANIAELDALIVPRLTTLDLTKGEVIPPDLFRLTAEQATVIREFVASGKPVLFALGPTNVGRSTPGGTADEIEALLPRLGIQLGRQTVLTDREATAMAERRDDALGSKVDVPSLQFDPSLTEGDVPNPVAEAFRVTARAVDRRLEIKRSGYRPLQLAPGFARGSAPAVEVARTSRESWNEERPLPESDYIPKFEPPKPDDPKKGTADEERRGPFTVGLALEVPVPLEWLPAKSFPAGNLDAASQQQLASLLVAWDGGLSAALLTAASTKLDRPMVRVAAFGHGGLFAGRTLDPAAEALLLRTLDWQLRRDDRLPTDRPEAEKWRFPRVQLSSQTAALWHWGMFLLLPLLCVYAGTLILMTRRLR